jgi:hypothetical protein
MKPAVMKTVLGNFDDAKRLVAKLMARENITVQVVDGLSDCALRYVVRRVLSHSELDQPDREQFDLLIGHEVGHALFTDNAYIETITGLKKHPGLMSYFNVVEDARIERKMKNVYPGLVKHVLRSVQDVHGAGSAVQAEGKTAHARLVWAERTRLPR